MKKALLLYILIIFSFWSCKTENKIDDKISEIPIDLVIERFDKAFSSTPISQFSILKSAYPFMFSKHYNDSIWQAEKQDTLQQMLYKEVDKEFKNFNELEIEQLFKYLKYYFPEFKTPRVVTTTSNVDYRNKIIVTDSITLIALDNYLGNDHEFYSNIQGYIKQNFDKNYIVLDLAEAYAKKYTYQKTKNLRDEMIYFGKLLYFKDVTVPLKTDAEKIGYTQQEFNWCFENESYIWRYFIENELLYSTDSKLPKRFINPAPFSKFNLAGIDNESPGKVGQYIGWQIVKAYMKNNSVSLKDMLVTEPEIIFKKSKFKPHKDE